MEKPSMRFSNNGSIASGVTSRPVKPVPPVVITTSTPGSAIQRLTTPRIASTSSVTISRAARRWPAAVRRSASTCPDLSSANARVSETVSTAMLRGINDLASSTDDIAPVPQIWRSPPLQRIRPEGVARLDRSLLIAGHEPAFALLGRPVREGIRHHAAGRLALQRVVADRSRRAQRGVDIALLQEI